jgi:uncharacterized protein YprB with RNaseH-like and TPR domain
MDLKDRLKYFEKDFTRPKTISVSRENDIDLYVEGEVISGDIGEYFLSSKTYPSDTRHGKVPIHSVRETDPAIFRLVVRDDTFPAVDFSRTLFIDTETTGLAGGTGTVPFLIGIGYFIEGGFQIDQYFMRDYHEETAVLNAVKDQFENCQVLVSYNGKCYDLNLLASRFTLSRMKNPAADIPHLDLLFPVRRLWRRRIGDCSLTNVERMILGFERENDIPGFLIPSIYFEYLRTRNGRSLATVFQHNRWDIIALAALAGLTGQIHQTPLEKLSHPADLYSLGRTFESMSRAESAIVCLKEAIRRSGDSEENEEMVSTLGMLYKRLEYWDEALKIWQSMVDHSVGGISPYEEIAKYLEHRRRDYPQAIEIVNRALKRIQLAEGLHPEYRHAVDRQDLEYRLARLIRKLNEKKHKENRWIGK